MARRWFITFASLLICTFSLWAKVRVLSVCIGSYPSESGWCDLASANDNNSICSIFPDVTSMVNADATYKAFTRELDKLRNTSIAGDTVIIHFSGHGQQILTPSSACEPDHVDEGLVMYDAAKYRSQSYHGQNHMTDNSFRNYISAIRRRLGKSGLVIAVIDACHSNSMDKDTDRSGEVYRGTDEIFGAEELSTDSVQSLREYYFANDKTPVDVSEDMAHAIFIGACETYQRNYEIKIEDRPHGSLTYYFCQAYREKGLSDINDFLSTLYAEMSGDNTMKFHGQNPSIRTSLDWKFPEDKKYLPQDIQPSTHKAKSNNVWIWVISGLGAIAAALLSTFMSGLWKRTK